MKPSHRLIYDFIQKRRADNKPTPTLKEISKHLGLTSIGGAQYVMNGMIKNGYVKHTPGAARSFIAVDKKRLA